MFDFKAEYLFITYFWGEYQSIFYTYSCGLDNFYQSGSVNYQTKMTRKLNSTNYSEKTGLGNKEYHYGKVIENVYYWYSTQSAQGQFNLREKEYTYVAF